MLSDPVKSGSLCEQRSSLLQHYPARSQAPLTAPSWLRALTAGEAAVMNPTKRYSLDLRERVV
jgi:hypothetical protein